MDGRRGKPQFTRPNENLKRKALNFDKGLGLVLTADEVTKLEQVVNDSRDGFASQVAANLRRLRLSVSALAPHVTNRVLELLQEVRVESYAIKGLGGTFGFPLLTAVAKSLNDYVEQKRALSERQTEVIRIHVDMLYLVVAQRVMSMEPTAEGEILSAFAELTRKVP